MIDITFNHFLVVDISYLLVYRSQLSLYNIFFEGNDLAQVGPFWPKLAQIMWDFFQLNSDDIWSKKWAKMGQFGPKWANFYMLF